MNRPDAQKLFCNFFYILFGKKKKVNAFPDLLTKDGVDRKLREFDPVLASYQTVEKVQNDLLKDVYWKNNQFE